MAGDPVNMLQGFTTHTVKDLDIDTGTGRFKLYRYYSGSTESSKPSVQSTLPWPGSARSPFGARTGTWQNPQWSHDLNSFVVRIDPGPTFGPFAYVFDGTLKWLDFKGVVADGGSYGFLPHARTAPATEERMERRFDNALPDGGMVDSYRLIHRDGMQWVYAATNGIQSDGLRPDGGLADGGFPVYFVSEGFYRSGQRAFSVKYANPTVSGITDCGGSPGGTPGVPFISRIEFPAGGRLEFTYTSNAGQCVIAGINWRASAAAGSATSVATYGYEGVAGRLASGGPTGKEETYVLDAGVAALASFSILEPGAKLKVIHKLELGGRVSALNGLSNEPDLWVAADNWANRYIGSYTGVACYNIQNSVPASFVNTTGQSIASSGAPGGAATSLISRYTSVDDVYYHQHGLRLHARVDICDGGFCSPGVYEDVLVGEVDTAGYCDNIDNPAITVFTKNKRDNWSGNVRRRAGDAGMPGDVYSWYTSKGSTSVQPNGYASGDRLEYAIHYDSPPTYVNGIRQPEPTYKPSTLSAGLTHQSFIYGNDGGAFTADLLTGNTIVGGSVVSKTRGTFTHGTRSSFSSATDTLGRALRVEGPCWTDGGTSCNGTDFPVTEFVYHAPSNTLESGRLRKVVRFPGYPNTTVALVTEYPSYTAEGMPLQVIDEAGVTATYTYAAAQPTKIATRTAGANVTTYAYEANGELRSVGYPGGDYFEVYCRFTAMPCPTSGTPTARVRWKAKSASSNGASYSELVEYEYSASGVLTKETYKDSTGAVRYVRNVFPDIHGRSTYENAGVDAGAVVTVRSFDPNNNVDAIGSSFAGAPAFCRASGNPWGTASPLCAWMTYDRADRLAQVDMNPSGAVDSTSIRTCFNYDMQGNVRRASAGCSSSDTCVTNVTDGGLTSCTSAPPVDYDVDDFGNVVTVKTPWSSSLSTSTARYEYDARGNVTKKTTQKMANDGQYIVNTYDQLGRQLSSIQDGTGGQVVLYYFGYDLPLGDSGCNVTHYVGGRMGYRWDSYGFTWYDYDAEGRVVAERRQRAGTQGACANTFADNPDTLYTYNAKGYLTGITYPYGRQIVYAYTNTNAKDRVTGVSAYLYLGGVWSKKGLVGSVTWEPYGGLKSYQYLSGTSWSTANTVEYQKSLASESAKASALCTSQTSEGGGSTDGTGRVRSLFVTQSDGGIASQFYTWKGDQLVTQQTCFGVLGQTYEHRQNFGYDLTNRLVTATGPAPDGGSSMPVRVTGTGANSHNRSYAYDRRGNRTGTTQDGCPRTYTARTGTAVDLLDVQVPDSSAGCMSRFSGYTYFDDADGRMDGIATAYYWWYQNFGFPASGGSPAPGHGGSDSVYKSMTVNGVSNYQYYYDALNRRRLKTYPFDSRDELFYDLGHQMLTSVGGDVMGTPTGWAVDDYVWLGGRAVAMIRGSMSTSWVRANDTTASCPRLGEAGKCGTYHIINDYLPKPIMMVESMTNLVTNAALYDEFGHVNRVPLITGLSTPPLSSQTLGSVNLPQGGNVTARVLYNYLDVPATTYVRLGGLAPLSAVTSAHLWSDWVAFTTTTPATVTIDASPACGGFRQPACKLGVQTEVLEYFRTSAGATPTWTPIRFPGQFHDPETDYFENWNRYYDPNVGRYHQPDPILNSPKRSPSLDAYSYAASRPTTTTDPSGLFTKIGFCPNYHEALKMAQKMAGCSPQTPMCLPNDNKCQNLIRSCTNNCNICDILQDGTPPIVFFEKNVQTNEPFPKRQSPAWGLTYYSNAGGNGVKKVEFTNSYCIHPPDAIILAGFMIHEAAHVCVGFVGGSISDYVGDRCEAAAIERECSKNF